MAVVRGRVDGEEYTGLSTDIKPTKRIAIGTIFKELDTGFEYRFNGNNWINLVSIIGNRVWDSEELAWVAMTQPVIKTDSLTVAGSMSVTNFPSPQQVSGTVSTDIPQLTLRVDDTTDENVIYLGEAAVGSAEDASAWRIKKIDMNVGVITKWAEGVSTLTHKWSDHTTLNYS